MSVRPYTGHFNPFVPLLRALERAGHRVLVATGPELSADVVAAGFAWAPAGMAPESAEAVLGEVEDTAYGPEVQGRKVDELLALALGSFWPDLVLREPTDLAPALVAELLGVPCVNFGIARFIPPSLWRHTAGDSLAALRRRFGLAPDPELAFLTDDLYVDIVPPPLQGSPKGPVAARQLARYVPWDGGEGRAPPAWLDELPGRPTVLVTLGTVYSQDTELFETFWEALAGEEWNVVCTLGSLDPAVLGPVPPNVTLARYLPHSLVLGRCAAMVCHGGFNTTMGALCEGVPVVCVPLGSDQYFNAARCHELGLGIRLPRASVTVEGVRAAVAEVVEDPGYRRRVGELRAAIAALPPYRRVVRRLEALAAGDLGVRRGGAPRRIPADGGGTAGPGHPGTPSDQGGRP